MTATSEAARYVARRTVLVVGGTVSGAREIADPLIAAGVELHVIAGDDTGRLPGVASWNGCDLESSDALDAAMARIGAVVQNVFHTAPNAAAFGSVARAAKPLMLVGGAIVAVGGTDSDVAAFVADHAPAYLEAGVRLVVAETDRALEAGAPGLA